MKTHRATISQFDRYINEAYGRDKSKLLCMKKETRVLTHIEILTQKFIAGQEPRYISSHFPSAKILKEAGSKVFLELANNLKEVIPAQKNTENLDRLTKGWFTIVSDIVTKEKIDMRVLATNPHQYIKWLIDTYAGKLHGT
jgi:hypothetical protein